MRYLSVTLVLLIGCSGGGSRPILPDGSLDAAEPDAAIDAAIDARPDASTLGAACNPLTQAPCGGGEKCAWVEDSENPPVGHSACVATGTVAVGGACTVGPAGPMGYSNCVKGSECVAGVCKSICNDQGGAPACDSNHSCGHYEGLFESGSINVAGVCDVRCDPLTQTLAVGTVTAACGSPNPAMPNAGCFTFDGLGYTCAPVGPSTLPLTDRQPARGPASGGAYVNGCSPGFLPFFRQMTGSNTIVCAGMCAPLKTDSALVALPGNVSANDATPNANRTVGSQAVPTKLPLEAAPAAGNGQCVTGKKGSVPISPVTDQENCLFMWPFNVENGTLPASPYNNGLGVCFDFRAYTYDHDNNAGTPNRPIPSCRNLPPTEVGLADCTCTGGSCSGTSCIDGLAKEWGCWNSIDSGQAMSFTGGGNAKAPAMKPVMREFRVGGYGDGAGVRHAIDYR